MTVAERIKYLSPRERQVLDGVYAGRLNKQIGRELGIGMKTVEAHRAHMMAKMEFDNVAQLVRAVYPILEGIAPKVGTGGSNPAPASCVEL